MLLTHARSIDETPENAIRIRANFRSHRSFFSRTLLVEEDMIARRAVGRAAEGRR
jgi:hypothetical protein